MTGIDASIDGEPAWLTIARNELGVHETPGIESTKRIDEYLRSTHLPERFIEDETPWCSAFVCWCLKQAGIESTRSAAALSYLKWGRKLDAPELGCVVVLTRPGSPGSGHVGMWLRADETHVRLLGGNQNNSVCERMYPLDRVLGYRWPA